MRVVILDVCSGNVRSVARAVRAAAVEVARAGALAAAPAVELTADPTALASADAVVVPGQGAFGVFATAMRAPRGRAAQDVQGARGGEDTYERALRQYLASGRPYLGICLGMQILLSDSDEQGLHRGLDVVAGPVRRVSNVGASGLPRKVPHMGWNQVSWTRPDHALAQGLTENAAYMYFVHSYAADARALAGQGALFATTNYDGEICAAVVRDNAVGVQFHPEKSGAAGLRFLANFLGWRP